MIKIILLACPLLMIQGNPSSNIINVKNVTKVTADKNISGGCYWEGDTCYSTDHPYLEIKVIGGESFKYDVQSGKKDVLSKAKQLAKIVSKQIIKCSR